MLFALIFLLLFILLSLSGPLEILFSDTLIDKFSKFSFFFCSSIKEPDQYDYYADEKPVLYKGIADLYTVSKVKQFRRENSNSLTFFKPTERCVIFVILANFVVNNWSSIKTPERNRSRSRNLYNDFANWFVICRNCRTKPSLWTLSLLLWSLWPFWCRVSSNVTHSVRV